MNEMGQALTKGDAIMIFVGNLVFVGGVCIMILSQIWSIKEEINKIKKKLGITNEKQD